MAMTQEEANNIKRAVRKLVAAEIEHSWIGAKDPIYHADIQADLRSARATFARAVSIKAIKATAKAKKAAQQDQPTEA